MDHVPFSENQAMKKFFALMVVFAALTAVGCAKEDDTMAPPAEDQAVPADDMPAEGEEDAIETP